ncbi:STT3 domain-containing protein [Pseudodesulfovibrio pelocollis]|uniref:STT3 domain-containing protein n=1 Tax=Pseudodesulfovibrio pelocollis TaxID=3051432 RepID=UPI00255B1733|nr:STT3 domain-containing protein [Pseudodesulfovibrio sp. SB368]
MQRLVRLYRNGMDHVGPAPSWSDHWRLIGVYGIAIFVVGLLFRISFAGRWDHPELWVAGERILATHDAYYWLAKAKGLGQLAGYPLAELAAWVHGLAGIGLGDIGFWTPAVLGSLVGVVCFLWGWLLGGVNAGVLAGLIGGLTPGFFYRTRLGYFDTDLFTLLMPMLVAWMLAFWAGRLMRPGWFLGGADEPESVDAARILWLALGFGLASRFAVIWHEDIQHMVILYYFMTIAVLMINCRPGLRALALQGLVIFAIASFPGGAFGRLQLWPFSSLLISVPAVPYYWAITLFSTAVAAGFVFFWKPTAQGAQRRRDALWVAAIVLIAVILSTKMINASVGNTVLKLLSYVSGAAGVVESGGGAAIMGPVYPSVLQSIIEVRLEPLSEILERGVFFSWLGWLALPASLVVVALRPAAVFLLPLIGLQLASVKLGIRFSMFGGAALCVMLGVCLYWLATIATQRSRHGKWIDLGVQAVLGAAMLVYCQVQYSTLPLTPVLSRAHAEALVELGRKSEPEAMVWTWWDWGYATQYYALLGTVADGGKHAGRDLFPLGFAMASQSPERASRMMRFAAQYPAIPVPYGLDTATVWDAIPRDRLGAALEEQLGQEEYPPVPPQYFVVSWNDLTLAKWITHFGNWNLETGVTREATASNFQPGELGFNVERGAVMDRQGGGGLVRDITVLDQDGINRRAYPMNALSPQLLPKAQHLVINMITKQSVILDAVGFQATMTRLMTGDPGDPAIAPYFRLVVDGLPFVRIYEVIQ